MKKMLVIVLSLALIAGVLPAGVFAADKKDSGNKKLEQFAKELKKQNEHRDPFDYVSSGSGDALKLNEEYPEQFDLSAKFLTDGDETPYVTPVKFQNPFGTCWGFAAVAAAEVSVIGSGLAAADGYAAIADPDNDIKALNLSEKHLVYFVNQAINDKSHSQYGEGRMSNDDVTVSEKLNTGGQMTYAAGLFSSGMGVNLEDRTDPNDNDKPMNDILEYRGLEGNVQKQKVNGKIINYCYDDEDDWSIPEKYRFYQSYMLKEAYELPSPAGENEDGGYEYNEAATLMIKDQLMAKRGVAIGFHADSYIPGKDDEGEFISKNWAHYTYENYGANHGVTIVGWDDNYPKENFVEGHQPDKNGAWLVKNSWGSGEEEFPNMGPASWGVVNEETGKHTGYFWLSYYDKTISMIEAFEFDKSNVGKTYNLDQYDLMPVNNIDTFETEDVNKMANVFKADTCQTIDQISCITAHPGTIVESEIYLLNDRFEDPEDGLLVATVRSEPFKTGGFHKMDVEERPLIQKNQYYSVVQKHIMPEGAGYCTVISSANGKGISEAFDLPVWTVGVINKKESYQYSGGEWTDYRDIIDYLTEDDDEEYYTYDNFPIKAYSTPEKNISMITDSYIRLATKGEDSTDTMKVSFRGDKDIELDDIDLKLEFAEGGSDLVSVEADPENDYKFTITGQKAGTTKLYITADGIGTSVVDIKVIDPEIAMVFTFDDEPVYTGKAIEPNIIVIDNLGHFAEEDRIKVTFKNNVKCGKATVVISPTDDYYANTYTYEFKILPQRAAVKKLTPGKKSLTVTVKDQKKTGVSKYQVQYRAAGSKKWSKKTFSSKKNKLTLKKLKKGKKYEVKVRAYAKNAGYGEMSKVVKSRKIK